VALGYCKIPVEEWIIVALIALEGGCLSLWMAFRLLIRCDLPPVLVKREVPRSKQVNDYSMQSHRQHRSPTKTAMMQSCKQPIAEGNCGVPWSLVLVAVLPSGAKTNSLWCDTRHGIDSEFSCISPKCVEFPPLGDDVCGNPFQSRICRPRIEYKLLVSFHSNAARFARAGRYCWDGSCFRCT